MWVCIWPFDRPVALHSIFVLAFHHSGLSDAPLCSDVGPETFQKPENNWCWSIKEAIVMKSKGAIPHPPFFLFIYIFFAT